MRPVGGSFRDDVGAFKALNCVPALMVAVGCILLVSFSDERGSSRYGANEGEPE